MISYQAPDPYQSSIGAFFSSIFRPFFSSASVGRMILPAQERAATSVSEARLDRLKTDYHVNIDQGYVHTYDGAALETMSFSPEQGPSPRYIIKFNGNGGQFTDTLEQFASDANRLNATVIGFNCRGVSHSSLSPEIYRNLKTDGIAQVQRLLAEGVPSEQILLDGHSLGGSIATKVARHFHKKGYPIYLWNDRTLSSLAKAAAGIVCSDSSACMEDVGASSTYVVLASTGWNVDVAKAYKAIPQQYKGYMCVSKNPDTGIGDGVISKRASLHSGVKADEKRRGIQTGHKFTTESLEGGHNLPRSMLFSKVDPSKNAEQVFDDFVTVHLPLN